MWRTAVFSVLLAATGIGMVAVGRMAPASPSGGTPPTTLLSAASPISTTTTEAAAAPEAPATTTTSDPSLRPTPPPAVHQSWSWDDLAACESSNRWTVTRGVYQGGLQFDARTWDAFAPALGYPADAHLATRDQQIAVAERVLTAQGAMAWPTCAPRVGMTRQVANPADLPPAGPPDDVAD
jgi:hypothetical protein